MAAHLVGAAGGGTEAAQALRGRIAGVAIRFFRLRGAVTDHRAEQLEAYLFAIPTYAIPRANLDVGGLSVELATAKTPRNALTLARGLRLIVARRRHDPSDRAEK